VPDDEPEDAVPRRPLSATERLWNKALSGQARRVYAFGLVALPHSMGLEPVSQAAYRYDSGGALADHAEHIRIATELASEDGWFATSWHPECAEIFMRSADLIIWLDDSLARSRRRMASRRQTPSLVEAAAREAWPAWRRRRRGETEDRVSLLDLAHRARSASISAHDPVAPYIQIATSSFPGTLLRATTKEQIAALNSVRRNR
jgi:hypothetical protein